jgi:hypothetical protein
MSTISATRTPIRPPSPETDKGDECRTYTGVSSAELNHPLIAAMRYVCASERSLMMRPIEVAAASSRPDPVGHVTWPR